MLDKIIGFFTGGGTKAIETIASEWIETDLEQAEAKAVMVKTLDPNGLMRRELSRKITMYYGIYLGSMLLLLAIEFFAIMFGFEVNIGQLSATTDKLTNLFAPISALFGLIVSASFGVNYANTRQNK